MPEAARNPPGLARRILVVSLAVAIPAAATLIISMNAVSRAEMLKHQFSAQFVCPTNEFNALAIVSTLLGCAALAFYPTRRRTMIELLIVYSVVTSGLVFLIPVLISGRWPS